MGKTCSADMIVSQKSMLWRLGAALQQQLGICTLGGAKPHHLEAIHRKSKLKVSKPGKCGWQLRTLPVRGS